MQRDEEIQSWVEEIKAWKLIKRKDSAEFLGSVKQWIFDLLEDSLIEILTMKSGMGRRREATWKKNWP